MIHEAGESLAPGQFPPFHAPFHAHLPQPIGRESPVALYILPGNSLADVHGQAEIATRKETPLTGISLMGGDEIMAGHAVLVGEDEVVGLGPQQSDVQDARLPEALVLVPYVGAGPEPSSAMIISSAGLDWHIYPQRVFSSQRGLL